MWWLSNGSQWGEDRVGGCKSETRFPKTERSPNSEIRIRKPDWKPLGFRALCTLEKGESMNLVAETCKGPPLPSPLLQSRRGRRPGNSGVHGEGRMSS